LELKCVERLCDEQMAQCLNDLRASGLNVCRLINVQKPRAEWKRIASGYIPAEPVETPL
jgi:GxxExxY protein